MGDGKRVKATAAGGTRQKGPMKKKPSGAEIEIVKEVFGGGGKRKAAQPKIPPVPEKMKKSNAAVSVGEWVEIDGSDRIVMSLTN
jgi:hypothetical protein